MSSMIKPDVLYVVTDSRDRTTYGITPDGEGMYWYDTEDEATAGLPEQHARREVTDKELAVIRGEADPSSVPCSEPGIVHDPFGGEGDEADPEGSCTNCGLENTFHHGHTMWLSGGWWCDTCDSPLCELA